jgi:hypothetical protein
MVAFIELVIIVFLLRYLYSFAIKIISLEDKVDDAIIVLDENYKKISEILNRPVFFDSVEVRQVISSIYNCQKSIYDIAISLGSIESEEEEGDQGQKENTQSE